VGIVAVDKSMNAPLHQECVLSPFESVKTIQRISARDEAKSQSMQRNRDNKSNSKDSRIGAKFLHTLRERGDAVKFRPYLESESKSKQMDFKVVIPSTQELADALREVSPEKQPNWGQMNASQMLCHVCDFGDLYFGEIQVHWFTRNIARIIGPVFLQTLTRKSPLGETAKNMQTMPVIHPSKQAFSEWIVLVDRANLMLKRLDALEAKYQVHPLYGKMRTEDFSALVRHHTAHHFHQFGLI
jgi:hypothetical protein